ncbi:MAG: V-type ATPase subunit [Treponema sp.]|jgi:vacuolar-type H+-ATPase subunit C/Vma6|nr:V-type ATPase subunit [Treponema sp.]
MMLDAGNRAYAYTKACGIIGKSFLGKNIPSLAKVSTLSEFERLIFPERVEGLPGKEMLLDLESRIIKRVIRQILAIVNSYENPPALLIRQLRTYEYGDLKTCLHYIAAGKKSPPKVCDIGGYGTVRFDAYPDLKLMLAGTEFERVLSKEFNAKGGDFSPVETEIDNIFYRGLLEDLAALSGEDRVLAQRIIAEEISIRNCIWALRLRAYYQKSAAETGKFLMDLSMRLHDDGVYGGYHQYKRNKLPRGRISLSQEARESLEFQLDTREDWNGWRWEKLLNPESQHEHWIADPRYFQNAASQYLYRLAKRSFHRTPMSVSMAFCFIKLKQFEEDLLTSVVEGLGLGMPSGDVLVLLEVPA